MYPHRLGLEYKQGRRVIKDEAVAWRWLFAAAAAELAHKRQGMPATLTARCNQCDVRVHVDIGRKEHACENI